MNDYRIEFVIKMCNLITDYLNQHSFFFKNNSNSEINEIYDILKNAFHECRLLIK